MFKRVMVAVVGMPFLLLVLIWAPQWCTHGARWPACVPSVPGS